jgi:hypothetical protein
MGGPIKSVARSIDNRVDLADASRSSSSVLRTEARKLFGDQMNDEVSSGTRQAPVSRA